MVQFFIKELRESEQKAQPDWNYAQVTKALRERWEKAPAPVKQAYRRQAERYATTFSPPLCPSLLVAR